MFLRRKERQTDGELYLFREERVERRFYTRNLYSSSRRPDVKYAFLPFVCFSFHFFFFLNCLLLVTNNKIIYLLKTSLSSSPVQVYYYTASY